MVRYRLGKMASTLYALESVTYMTAGLADASPMAGPAHIEMEACMTKSFALGGNSKEKKWLVRKCEKEFKTRNFGIWTRHQNRNGISSRF